MAAISYNYQDEAYNLAHNITCASPVFNLNRSFTAYSNIQHYFRKAVPSKKEPEAPKTLPRKCFWQPNFQYRNPQLEMKMAYRDRDLHPKIFVPRYTPLLAKPGISYRQKRRNRLTKGKV